LASYKLLKHGLGSNQMHAIFALSNKGTQDKYTINLPSYTLLTTHCLPSTFAAINIACLDKLFNNFFVTLK